MRSPAPLALLVLLVATAVVYWQVLGTEFFFDDESNIVNIPAVAMQDLSADSIAAAWSSGIAGLGGRKLSQLSFALNHYFAGGFDPFAFRLVNLLIHLGGGLLLWRLSLLLLRDAATLRPDPYLAARAVVITGVWLLHPIQLLPVIYVVQRMAILAGLLMLLATLCHVAARGGPWRPGARSKTKSLLLLVLAWGVWWPLALLAKENAIVWPGLVLAWELTLRRRLHGGLDRFAIAMLVAAGLVLAAAAIYLAGPWSAWMWSGYDLRSFTPVERLLTEARVIWMYVVMTAAPTLPQFSLHHDDIIISTSLLSPWTTLPAVATVLAAPLLALRLARRRPLAALGILWFLCALSLESSLPPLQIAFEHRNYLALFGLLLLFASVTPDMSSAQPSWRRLLTFCFLLAWALNAVVTTALRADAAANEVTRTQLDAQMHPHSAFSQYEAGWVLGRPRPGRELTQGIYDLARRHFEAAGRLDPAIKSSWLGLVGLNCQMGMAIESAWVAELAQRLQSTSLSPGDENVFSDIVNMGSGDDPCFKPTQVIALFDAVAGNRRVSPLRQHRFRLLLARYLVVGLRQYDAGEQMLRALLQQAPHYNAARLRLAEVLFLQSRREEAAALLGDIDPAQLSGIEAQARNELFACMSQSDVVCTTVQAE